MSKSLQKKLAILFRKYRRVKLVYLFGSRARNDAGPLSDFDFAVYADTTDRSALADVRLKLTNDLTRLLKTDAVDVVMLNSVEQPELKYAIIKEGRCVYGQAAYKILVEPRIIIEYCDFKTQLQKYGLTSVL